MSVMSEEIKRLRRELAGYEATCERAIAGDLACPVIEDFLRGFSQRTNDGGYKP
ncbi:hypothetical protein HRbin10_00701 [bacterium HR10]|nr:hypothetical protein HRbin10_00701 [bacterium HR10]